MEPADSARRSLNNCLLHESFLFTGGERPMAQQD